MEWLAEQNIAHFRALLKAETDLQKRAILEQLLHQEEAKIARVKPTLSDPN